MAAFGLVEVGDGTVGPIAILAPLLVTVDAGGGHARQRRRVGCRRAIDIRLYAGGPRAIVGWPAIILRTIAWRAIGLLRSEAEATTSVADHLDIDDVRPLRGQPCDRHRFSWDDLHNAGRAQGRDELPSANRTHVQTPNSPLNSS